MPLWVSSMDLRKAFGSVDHGELLRGLHRHGVDESYLALIDLLYQDQLGSVHQSRSFQIS